MRFRKRFKATTKKADCFQSALKVNILSTTF